MLPGASLPRAGSPVSARRRPASGLPLQRVTRHGASFEFTPREGSTTAPHIPARSATDVAGQRAENGANRAPTSVLSFKTSPSNSTHACASNRPSAFRTPIRRVVATP